jgi:hypothetical protein
MKGIEEVEGSEWKQGRERERGREEKWRGRRGEQWTRISI